MATDHLTKIAAMRPDWRITVLTGDRAWDDPAKTYPATEYYRELKIIRVNRPPVRKNLLMRGLGFAILHRNMRRAAKHVGYTDLVIGTTAPPQGGILAARIARARRCPFIYTVLDLYPDVGVALGRIGEGSFFHKRWLRMDVQAMQAAAAVVSITTPMTERIARLRGIGRSKLHTIHDGYDSASLARSEENRFAAEFNPDGRFVVQYAGNMGLSHPLETILAAARQMADSDRDVLFQFVGEGPGRAALEKDCPPSVRLIPYQRAERLGEVLESADVGLISQHEKMYDQALPYKLYALMAVGRPCIFIGSDQSEIAGWLRDSGAGVVVRQGDAVGLIRAILELKPAAARERMGAAARRLFRDRFDSTRAASEWHDLIAQILGAP